jgi:hypothetical protein
MGEVYRARDSRLEREVAVKVLSERLAADADALARFEREAKSVAALSHPNILAIHDFGRDKRVVFAVTELLEGETLRSRLALGPLSWRKAVEIGVAIADGLAAAHEKRVIHRDIKPENVFLTTDGRVKILDFGLARMESRVRSAPSAETESYQEAQTEPGMVMGTVGYMSPEQVRGQAVDARSDIFSLGCVLHEMVAGRRTFVRDTSADTIAAILNVEPPELTDIDANVPTELSRAIHHCLEKNAASRFHSARDLAFALRSAPSQSVVRTASVFGAGRGWIGATGVLIAAVLGITGFVLTRYRDLRIAEPNEPAAHAKSVWHGSPADAHPPAIAPVDAREARKQQDPHRWFAEQILNDGGSVAIVANEEWQVIRSTEDLPHGAFELHGVDFDGHREPNTNRTLEGLRNLDSLRGLYLHGTQVTDDGLKHIRGQSRLILLWLQNTQLTDSGLVHLGGLDELEELDLSNTQVTDSGLQHLEGLGRLKKLDLSQTRVTSAAVERLRQSVPNCEIAHYPN